LITSTAFYQKLSASFLSVGENKDFLTDTKSIPFVKALQEKQNPRSSYFLPRIKRMVGP